MVTKVRFWLLESSRLIAKASFSVMILKSAFLNSLFTTRPWNEFKAVHAFLFYNRTIGDRNYIAHH